MSSLDQALQKLPRPILVFIALAGAVAFIWFANPPHTICDTQKEVAYEALRGPVLSTQDKKRKIPALLNRAKVACQAGVSPGSCYEYFKILKRVTQILNQASSECLSEVFETEEIKMTLKQGVELMALLAWGDQVPESSSARFGWMSESELSLFCSMRAAVKNSVGEETWNQWRLEVFKKYPLTSPELPKDYDPDKADELKLAAPKAISSMSEVEIWNKSLFSVRCEGFQAL